MKVEIKETKIPGCYELIPRIVGDERGVFVKTFHKEVFAQFSMETHFAEEYYSSSVKGVLRGLHFQTPPHDHVKIVYCVEGEVFDAVVDMRKGSPTYGEFIIFSLSSKKANMLYIPKGVAHGFYVISNTATLMYKVTTQYSPEHDTGILWSSVDIPWPDKEPIISVRDRSFVKFADFNSPFAL